ncbi:hypothetical protein EYF80_039320 [Liparis tanakae]|uniref:Uncharacterized protein n=1 Tax=Liparis tanakae TaxID=230148 RepID=A0A4Z2GBA2_9TELE|nr:hypothetical protein EYF80_039320 [Liparis tanakae]
MKEERKGGRKTESVRRRKEDGRADTERGEARKDGELQRHDEEQRTASIRRETERKRRRGRLSSQERNMAPSLEEVTLWRSINYHLRRPILLHLGAEGELANRLRGPCYLMLRRTTGGQPEDNRRTTGPMPVALKRSGHFLPQPMHKPVSQMETGSPHLDRHELGAVVLRQPRGRRRVVRERAEPKQTGSSSHQNQSPAELNTPISRDTNMPPPVLPRDDSCERGGQYPHSSQQALPGGSPAQGGQDESPAQRVVGVDHPGHAPQAPRRQLQHKRHL